MRENAWVGVLGVSVATVIAGVSLILALPSGTSLVGSVAGWVVTILGSIGFATSVSHRFVVEPIRSVSSQLELLMEVVARSDQINGFEAGVKAMQERWSAAANELAATGQLLGAAKQLGLEMVYRGRAEANKEIQQLFEGAREEVNLLGVCLMAQTNIVRFYHLVQEKIGQDVTFRFLFLRRDDTTTGFDFYRQRSHDEHYPMSPDSIGTLKEDAAGNIGGLQALCRDRLSAEQRRQLKIAEYEAFPYMSLIIIDDVMFVEPYLFGETCANTPIYRIRKTDRGIYQVYYNHFSELWKSAVKVDLEIQDD